MPEEKEEVKKKVDLPNKAFVLQSNKGGTVKIKFRMNRLSSDVQADASGVASVDLETAQRLVDDGYAEFVKE